MCQELSRIVAQVRAAAAEAGVRIVLRGDSGFCREAIMSCAGPIGLNTCWGLAKNSRLTEIIAGEVAGGPMRQAGKRRGGSRVQGLSLSDSRELDL